MKTPLLAAAVAAISWLILPAISRAAEATQLATITVTTPDAVNILSLTAGQPRLYDSNPLQTIETVRPDLAGAEFTSIPQKIVNQYQIHVETPGVIYAFGGTYTKPRINEDKLLGVKDARWIRDLAISGQALGTCYRRTVFAGENLSLHGFELQLAARTIAVAGPGGVVQNQTRPPSKQIEPLLDPSLNAILAPLQENPPMPRVAVEKVRALLGAGQVRAKTTSLQQVYQCAMAVCEALTNAMDQRAESRAAASSSGLVPSLSNGGSIIISSGRGSGPGAGGAGEAIRKKQNDERSYADRKAKGLSNFIDSAAYKEWVTRTAGLRTNVMDLYTRLVQLEATEPTFNPVPANVVANLAVPNAVAPNAVIPNAAPATSPPVSPVPEAKADAFVNSLGMKFVPAGTPGVLFCIWDTRVKDFAQFVELSGYDMSKGEKAITLESDGKGGHAWKHIDGTWRDPHFPQDAAQTEDHPVVCVSWKDAKAFCAWLTKKERDAGVITAEQSYRLPMDHEWSTAVGIGDREDASASPASKNGKIKGVYPWGTEWPPPAGAGNFAGEESRVLPGGTDKRWTVIEGYNDGFPCTSPVGSFPPNRYGLYDMAGNVWQVTEDRFDPNSADRVQRGGCCSIGQPIPLQSSHRRPVTLGDRFCHRGFRVVLVTLGGANPPNQVSDR